MHDVKAGPFIRKEYGEIVSNIGVPAAVNDLSVAPRSSASPANQS